MVLGKNVHTNALESLSECHTTVFLIVQTIFDIIYTYYVRCNIVK